MKMHILSGGRLRMRRNIYDLDAPRDETFELPVSSYLLRHRHGNVLFDTGCHPDAATGAEARWGAMVRAMTPIFAAEDSVVHQLPRLGLACEDIDVVVCSHLHPDHCGCTAFFPQATVIAHEAEIAAARAPAASSHGYFPVEWDDPRHIESLTGQRDLFGDGRITLLPMPGHTAGMTVAHVVLDRDGAFLLASDAAPLKHTLDTLTAPRNSWDVEQTLASLRAIADIARDGTRIIHGHDDEQLRGMRQGADGYA